MGIETDEKSFGAGARAFNEAKLPAVKWRELRITEGVFCAKNLKRRRMEDDVTQYTICNTGILDWRKIIIILPFLEAFPAF